MWVFSVLRDYKKKFEIKDSANKHEYTKLLLWIRRPVAKRSLRVLLFGRRPSRVIEIACFDLKSQ